MLPTMRSDRFRTAAEAKDFSAVDELLAENVSFRSPVVFAPYKGREALTLILGAVAEVFEDFRYTDQVESDNLSILVFEARIGNRELNGVDLLRFNADGRIGELMVMVRPMSAVTALAEAMQVRLAAAGG
jgi:SnoaL-like domain